MLTDEPSPPIPPDLLSSVTAEFGMYQAGTLGMTERNEAALAPELPADPLVRLQEMSASSNDRLMDTAYHGAEGAALFSQNKFDEAISHLEEDTNNPFSLQLLAEAYQKTGDISEAHRTTETLANFNDPTVEQALVVPAFRKCYQDPTCNSNLKGVSLKKSFPKTF